jgi:hypothetical protein
MDETGFRNTFFCWASPPGLAWVCTNEKNHEGDHVARGCADEVFHTWPREEETHGERS